MCPSWVVLFQTRLAYFIRTTITEPPLPKNCNLIFSAYRAHSGISKSYKLLNGLLFFLTEHITQGSSWEPNGACTWSAHQLKETRTIGTKIIHLDASAKWCVEVGGGGGYLWWEMTWTCEKMEKKREKQKRMYVTRWVYQQPKRMKRVVKTLKKKTTTKGKKKYQSIVTRAWIRRA